jgi:hypothetical protein
MTYLWSGAAAAIGVALLAVGVDPAAAGPVGTLVGGATPQTYMIGCAVCAGGGILLALEGSMAVWLFLAKRSSFGVIGACVGVCGMAFGI